LVDALVVGGEQSISALGAAATISRQALTKHLRVLEQVGLVAARRDGREVRFRI
jgi:DNA-binding transcriptional ArsR family regulator